MIACLAAVMTGFTHGLKNWQEMENLGLEWDRLYEFKGQLKLDLAKLERVYEAAWSQCSDDGCGYLPEDAQWELWELLEKYGDEEAFEGPLTFRIPLDRLISLADKEALE